MLEHTPEAAAAIEGRERTFTTRLLIDWDHDGTFGHALSDLSGYVVTWRREHTLSSTAPDELMLIEGHSAAQLDITLAGTYDGDPLAVQFAPYNRRSAFSGRHPEGAPVRLDVAVWTDEHGYEWFPQFRGVVRNVDTDRADGTVALECLDHAELLRGPVNVPPYALWQTFLQQGCKRGGLIDSSALVDLAARAGGFTMGPALEPDFPAAWANKSSRVVSVPLHGSVLPEIGTLDNDQSFHRTEQWETSTNPATRARGEAWREGPHGYLALNAVPRGAAENYKKYWCDDTRQVAGGTRGTWLLGCWLYWTGTGVDENSTPIEINLRDNRLQLVVDAAAGTVAARLVEHTGTTTTGPSAGLGAAGWHYVEAAFSVGDQVHMRTTVDTRRSAVRLVLDRQVTYPINTPLSGLTRIEHRYALSDVVVWQCSDPHPDIEVTCNPAPVGNARVSWGRNRMTFTLRETGREAFDLAKDVAAAEFGAVLFDEHGRFCFYNYDDVTDRQSTVVRTFGVDDLANLHFRSTLDSVRNVWVVTTTSARTVTGIVYDLADDDVPLYRAASGELLPADFVVSGQGSRELFVPVDDHVIAVNPWEVPNLDPAAYWDTYVPTHARQTYTGTDFREGTTVKTEQKMVRRDLFRLWVPNGWSEPVGFVNPDGSARFRVEGTLVVEDDPKTWTIRVPDSIAAHDERVIELSGTWLQDEWQTRAMLACLVPRLGQPIPVADDITVPGDPRVQVLDCVRLADPSGFGTVRVQIYGITREVDTDGRLVDTYRVEAIAPPSPGIWNSSRWDSTFLWS